MVRRLSSSLLQRWRELENRALPEQIRPESEINHDDLSHCSSTSPYGAEEFDLGSSREQWSGPLDSERVSVREIALGWITESSGSSSSSSSPRDVRGLGEREEREGVELVTDQGSRFPEQTRRCMPWLRGRQARVDLIMRMTRERQRELERLLERRAVSEFSHRSRIQSLLRCRFLRSGRSPEDERQSLTGERELGQIRRHHTIGSRDHQSQSNLSVEMFVNENYYQSPSESNGENIYQEREAQAASDLENMVQNRNEYSQEYTPTNDNWAEEDTGNGQQDWQQIPAVGNAGWNDNVSEANQNHEESHGAPRSEEASGGGLVLEGYEVEDETHEIEENWRDSHSLLAQDQMAVIDRNLNRFTPPDNYNVYNMELRELVSRRSVSNLLHSEFRGSLDQLIQSYVQRQDHLSHDWEVEEALPATLLPDEDQDQNREDLHQALHASAAITSIELPSPPEPRELSWQSEFHPNNWTPHATCLSEFEWDIVSDLKADMARLEQGMSHMHKMLEACMDFQMELQRSIRQEVSAALNRDSGGCVGDLEVEGTTDYYESRWSRVKKGTCCVCCDAHIDALLYRCGHLCACSKCAAELLQGGGRCPLCRAPIIEVVQVYSII